MKNIKKCWKCKKTEEDVSLIKNSKIKYKEKVYQYYSCNDCNTERHRSYQRTYSGKIAIRNAVNKYEKKNPIKVKSWKIAKCILSKPCIICGKKKTDKHHEDSSRPLEVIFLCRLHHRRCHIYGIDSLKIKNMV